MRYIIGDKEIDMAKISIDLRDDVFNTLSAFCKERGYSNEDVAADVIREFIGDYIADEKDDEVDAEEVQRIVAEIDAGRMELIPAEQVYEELGI